MCHHRPHYTTPAQGRHDAEAWAALVFGANDLGADPIEDEIHEWGAEPHPPALQGKEAATQRGESPSRLDPDRHPEPETHAEDAEEAIGSIDYAIDALSRNV